MVSADPDVALAHRVLSMNVAAPGVMSRVEAEVGYNTMLMVAHKLARRVLAEAEKEKGRD